MKSIEADSATRLKACAILGQQTGTFAQMKPLWKVFLAFELTEEERKQIHLNVLPQAVTWTSVLPAITISLEDSDAEALSKVLTTWPHMTAEDTKWAEPLLRQLAA